MSDRPRVLISRCLGFEACRYDGGIIRSDFADALREQVEVLTVCPEAELGLGTPRPTLRLVARADGPRMLQSGSERDLGDAMTDWSQRRLDDLGPIDGALLKSRSPSCAIGDAKLHAASEEAPVIGSSPGIFALALRTRHARLACIDEGRATNAELRHHWLSQVFAAWRFREAAARNSLHALMEFHARHKFLLLAQSESRLREMGRLLAESSAGELGTTTREYQHRLLEALAQPSTPQRHVNVLQHAFGHLSDRVSAAEREHFTLALQRYRDGFLALGTLQFLLASWALRFQDEYLLQQAYLEPYPAELHSKLDSSKQSGPRAAP